MVLRALIVIGKHDVQHVAGQALQRLVPLYITRTRPSGGSPAQGEAAILVQEHATAILQRGELTYRKALICCSVGALLSQIADGAETYDATRIDGRETTGA